MIWHDMIRYYMIRYDKIQFDMIWINSICLLLESVLLLMVLLVPGYFLRLSKGDRVGLNTLDPISSGLIITCMYSTVAHSAVGRRTVQTSKMEWIKCRSASQWIECKCASQWIEYRSATQGIKCRNPTQRSRDSSVRLQSKTWTSVLRYLSGNVIQHSRSLDKIG